MKHNKGGLSEGLVKKEAFTPEDSRPKVCKKTDRLKPNDPMIKRNVKMAY